MSDWPWAEIIVRGALAAAAFLLCIGAAIASVVWLVLLHR